MTGRTRRKPSVPAPAPQRAAATHASGAHEFSFYEGSPRVKPPAAGFGFTAFASFRSFKQPSRRLARFTRECERESLVTTFYPCRHAMPST